MYKIVLVNHTFRLDYMRYRWELLARGHKDIDVTLISPKVTDWNGSEGSALTSNIINDENFHMIPVAVEFHRNKGWTSQEMLDIIHNIHPDLVYYIGGHTDDALMQLLDFIKNNIPSCKIAAFSMRGPNYDISYRGDNSYLRWFVRKLVLTPRIRKLNKEINAICCHYPDALQSFKKEGFNGPIYLSTQVGVNTDIYCPDESKRKEIREKYNINNYYVFGSASRFAEGKGLDDIIDALPQEGDWKFLMMGNGSNEEMMRVKNHILKRGLEDKIILTGHVDQSDMSYYWNACDCAIHVPRTGNWTETFSLALVQAMATKIPVIGSSSGSVPYQIGPDGIIVGERDIEALNKKICWVLDHREEAKMVGERMRWRAVHCFDIKHLNDHIYDIFMDIINDKYDENKVDQANFTN